MKPANAAAVAALLDQGVPHKTVARTFGVTQHQIMHIRRITRQEVGGVKVGKVYRWHLARRAKSFRRVVSFTAADGVVYVDARGKEGQAPLDQFRLWAGIKERECK